MMIQEHEVKQQTTLRPSADIEISLARILVATDFSKTSERALGHALSWRAPMIPGFFWRT
jgi:hypothetical protein